MRSIELQPVFTFDISRSSKLVANKQIPKVDSYFTAVNSWQQLSRYLSIGILAGCSPKLFPPEISRIPACPNPRWPAAASLNTTSHCNQCANCSLSVREATVYLRLQGTARGGGAWGALSASSRPTSRKILRPPASLRTETRRPESTFHFLLSLTSSTSSALVQYFLPVLYEHSLLDPDHPDCHPLAQWV